jgi:hypothetical protein
MKTKSRIKITPQTKPLTHLYWVDIHATNPTIGVRNPVAYGFVSPDLLKFLRSFGLQSHYDIYSVTKSQWEEVSK